VVRIGVAMRAGGVSLTLSEIAVWYGSTGVLREGKMKTSSLLRASIVALAALTLATDGVFASIALNSSRSNIYKAINPNDQNAVKACTKGGGTVGKDPKGQDACITRATKSKK
jgi:hypothetical protein